MSGQSNQCICIKSHFYDFAVAPFFSSFDFPSFSFSYEEIVNFLKSIFSCYVYACMRFCQIKKKTFGGRIMIQKTSNTIERALIGILLLFSFRLLPSTLFCVCLRCAFHLFSTIFNTLFLLWFLYLYLYTIYLLARKLSLFSLVCAHFSLHRCVVLCLLTLSIRIDFVTHHTFSDILKKYTNTRMCNETENYTKYKEGKTVRGNYNVYTKNIQI